MKRYSKLIGMVIGMAAAYLVNAGLVAGGIDAPTLTEAVYVILTGFGVYAPTNAQ